MRSFAHAELIVQCTFQGDAMNELPIVRGPNIHNTKVAKIGLETTSIRAPKIEVCVDPDPTTPKEPGWHANTWITVGLSKFTPKEDSAKFEKDGNEIEDEWKFEGTAEDVHGDCAAQVSKDFLNRRVCGAFKMSALGQGKISTLD